MKLYNRHTVRLREFDYAQNGVYFVTICTHEKECLFGDVQDAAIVLHEYGKIVQEELERSAEIREEMDIDTYIIMPNHVHVIVALFQADDSKSTVGASGGTPTGEGPLAPTLKPRSLGAFVSGFKSATTVRINRRRNMPREPVWQRNYWEHVIRNENELHKLRDYIQNNPQRWELNRDYGNLP
jgi:REP-associated tyrosine transposase